MRHVVSSRNARARVLLRGERHLHGGQQAYGWPVPAIRRRDTGNHVCNRWPMVGFCRLRVLIIDLDKFGREVTIKT